MEEGDRERRRQRFWRSQPVLHFEGEQWKVSDLKTGQEAVESCHFRLEVHSAMSDCDSQNMDSRTATVEAKNTPR